MVYAFNGKCNMANNPVISSYNSRADYEAKKADTRIDFAVVNNYEAKKEQEELSTLINKLKDLDTSDNKDGTSTLSPKDLTYAKNNAKSIFGENVVVRSDASKGLTTIQLENGKIYAFDFEVKGEPKRGITQLKEDIANGNAQYERWFNPDVLMSAILQSHGATIQDEIIVKAENGTTMKEIKAKYNLPDGALKTYVCFCQQGTGDRDAYTVDGERVWFSARAFAENNNLTMDQVKQLFKQK